MKGPFPMGTGAESLFHVDKGDVGLKTQPVKYTSNDGSLSCKLTLFTPSLSFGRKRENNSNYEGTEHSRGLSN
jgi:hypothetical protein